MEFTNRWCDKKNLLFVLYSFLYASRQARSGAHHLASLMASLQVTQEQERITSPPMASMLCPPFKAVMYDQYSEPDKVLRMADVGPVELGARDVCVKMLAAPINPSDINSIEGVYPNKPTVPGAVGGIEGVGQVQAVGQAVTASLSPGDWVIAFPHTAMGTWQTYAVKPQVLWHKVRNDVPMEYAATVTVNPLSALVLLQCFTKLNPGDTIVQNGATSIVGQCVIQLAKAQGLRTISIIRDRPGSEQAKHRLTQLGAHLVFTESQLRVKNVKSLLGTLPEPALGFDCVGGNAASLTMRFLRKGGTMVTYGGMSKEHVNVSTSSFIFKDLSFKGFWLWNWVNSDKVEDCKKMIDYLLDLVKEGKLTYQTELTPFRDFGLALDKAQGKLGAQPKQVVSFWDKAKL